MFIYINIHYIFSLGSQDFFGAAPGLKFPAFPSGFLQCRCFPWALARIRTPVVHWFTARQPYGGNIS